MHPTLKRRFYIQFPINYLNWLVRVNRYFDLYTIYTNNYLYLLTLYLCNLYVIRLLSRLNRCNQRPSCWNQSRHQLNWITGWNRMIFTWFVGDVLYSKICHIQNHCRLEYLRGREVVSLRICSYIVNILFHQRDGIVNVIFLLGW